MKLSFANFNQQPLEQGECDLEQALHALAVKYEAGLAKYDTFEEAYSQTYMCLRRNENDFIELTANGHDAISLHSDRLFYSGFFDQLISVKNHFSASLSKVQSEDVVRVYYDTDRKNFEIRFASYRSR